MKSLNNFFILPILVAATTILLIQYVYFQHIDWGFFGLMLIPVLMIAVGSYWLTQQRLKKIKRQLYEILKTLEAFDIDEPQKVSFKNSPFPIFNELNDYLIELVERVRTDYLANKQFTENAAHELQTPLAVIKGQAELLIQSQHIDEQEMMALGTILQNANRLSKINGALILLSKIEHQRFSDLEIVDFGKVLTMILVNFQDLLNIKEISVHQRNLSSFKQEMSVVLAEILLTNLLQNAIRHNTNHFIDITIDETYFEIANAGEVPVLSTRKLFTRFKRMSNKEESLGLGLSIVQRICEHSNLAVDYTYDKTERHVVRIRHKVT